MNRPAPPGDLVDRLGAIVGPAHVVVDAAEREPHERDWTGRFRGSTPAVVRPGSTAEVAGVVRTCAEAGVAVVAQGGNTGLVGGATPADGAVVVDLRRLDHVGPVDPAGPHITAGAGATLGDVQRAAAAGLLYPVDLAARDTATIGGTVATNAGGVHVVRWGTTRRQLLGIEAVLADGSVVSHLGGLPKDATGYDLAGLLCGSEGTLGVITAVCLRLVVAPARKAVAWLGVADVATAVAAVARWRRHLPSLSAAEVVVGDALTLVSDELGLPAPLERPWPAALLVEAAGEEPATELAAVVGADPVVGEAVVGDDPRSCARLWRYREDLPEAIGRRGTPHKLDVAVPPASLATFVDAVPTRVADVAPAATAWIFGHVGDGNLHVNVTGVDPDDEVVDDAVLALVAEHGGAISAEHGIGRAKRRWLHLSRSPAEIAAYRAVKAALDPGGILAPGVLLPP